MKRLIWLAALFSGVVAAETIENRQPYELSQQVITPIQQELWIDIRTAEEYDAGHLEDAINIPYEEIVARLNVLNLDKNKPISVHCRSGRRSEIARQMLQDAGYTNVTNRGAYQDLLKN